MNGTNDTNGTYGTNLNANGKNVTNSTILDTHGTNSKTSVVAPGQSVRMYVSTTHPSEGEINCKLGSVQFVDAEG